MFEVVFHQAYPMARRAARVRAANALEAKSLTYEDRRDLEQEALLALWRSLPKFDPTRASIRTFAERVIANKIASVVRAQRAVRRTSVLVYSPAYTEHPEAQVQRRVDVVRVLGGLSERERRLALMLIEHTPSETSRELRISR